MSSPEMSSSKISPLKMSSKMSSWKEYNRDRVWDERIHNFIVKHINLLILLVLIIVIAWGLESGHVSFVVGLIVIGGLSYFRGLTVAMMVGVIWSGIDIYTWTEHSFIISQILIEFICNALIAWLGYGHKKQNLLQKRRVANDSHVDPVVPWAVANEIRTSLAAVRYLLFPLEHESNQAVHTATTELSRVEELFNELERTQQENEIISK